MKVKLFVKKYWEYMLAFLIPVIIMLLHCIIRNSWLFGEGSILCGDAGSQYIYVYEELWNKVHSGDSIFYSWNALCGYDFYLNMLYYTISPATVVILLLPKYCLEDAVQFFMVMKWALLSFTTVYFFMHTKFNTLKKNRRLVSLVLGLCFAMSNFFLSILCFFNWMDTLTLFPILLLLVEKMVEKGSWKRYYIFLTIAIVCNFYIAFPVCIFLFLWFLLQLQTISGEKKKTVITFLGSSLLTGISSMGIIIPCVANVSSRYAIGKEEETASYIRSILEVPSEVIEKFFVFNSINEVGFEHTAFYMSIGCVFLSTLFCFVKMNRKVKYTKLILGIFVFASLFVGILNYIWHGASIPHGNGHRYGFVLIMLLLIMVLDVLIHVDELKTWQCALAAGIDIALFIYAFFNIVNYEEVYVYFSTIMLLVFDFILLVLLCRKSIKKNTFIKLILIICMIEISANAYYQLQYYDAIKPEEAEFAKETAELAEEVSVKDGERIAIVNAGLNLGMKVDLPSMSGFLSYANGNMAELASELGMNASLDSGFLYTGCSPLLNLMFNVGGGIGQYKTSFSDCKVIKKNDDLSIYEIERLAGLGYMVKNSVTDWSAEGLVPFETQNEFVQCALETEDEIFHVFRPEVKCFTALGSITPMLEEEQEYSVVCKYVSVLEQDGIIINYTVDKDMDLYVKLMSSAGFTAGVTMDDEVVYRDSDEKGQVTIHIGKVKKGQKIAIACGVEDEIGNEIGISAQFAEFNQEVYQRVYEKLSHSVYRITEMKDDYICGMIKADEEGIMMTSIQAMDGFTVFVDGEKTDYKTIGGALIGVPLKKGEHIVEFRYQTPYAKLGWLVSVCGMLIFIIICLTGRKKNAPVFCETESVK